MSKSESEEGKYVALKLNEEYYAIPVGNIQEVFVPQKITSIPQAPEFTAGVINFRGTIVTVIDLKKRLQIAARKKKAVAEEEVLTYEDDEDKYYVIIVNMAGKTLGLLVDYVESVITISQKNIQEALELISSATKTVFMSGVARTEYGVTILLQLDTLLSEYELKDLDKLAKLREEIRATTGEEDEVVVDQQTLLDLDSDDIDPYVKGKSEREFKKIKADDSSIGGGLDLGTLSKAELLKIAVEMEIPDVSSKTTKSDLLKQINKAMGN